MDEADFHPQVARTSPLGPSLQLCLENKSSGTKPCSELQTNCEVRYILDWVRASTRELNVCAESKDKRLL